MGRYGQIALGRPLTWRSPFGTTSTLVAGGESTVGWMNNIRRRRTWKIGRVTNNSGWLGDSWIIDGWIGIYLFFQSLRTRKWQNLDEWPRDFPWFSIVIKLQEGNVAVRSTSTCAPWSKSWIPVGLYRLFLSVLGGWSSIFPLPRPALSYLEAEQAVDAPATHHGWWHQRVLYNWYQLLTNWPTDVERDGSFLDTVLKNHEMLSHQSI